MRAWLTRLKFKFLMYKNMGDNLNRRVQVENWLALCYSGAKPLPDIETCRWLALRLGTPSSEWGPYLQKVPDTLKARQREYERMRHEHQ